MSLDEILPGIEIKSIYLCKQNGKYIMRNVTRKRGQTKKQKRIRKCMKILTKIFSETYSLIEPIWVKMNKLPIIANFISHNKRFFNYKYIDCARISLSVGTIRRPEISQPILIHKNKIKFKILNYNSGYKIGMIVMDKKWNNFKIYRFEFREYGSNEIELNFNQNLDSKVPILWVIFEYKGEYSNSICRRASKGGDEKWQK